MNKKILFAFILSIICSGYSELSAQQQQPFVFTLHGGLFFPSKAEYFDTYRSHSDLVWSAGIALPVNSGLFVTADAAWFTSEAFFNVAGDSVGRYEERIVRIGILSKQPLSRWLSLRLIGGLNRVRAREFISGQQTAEQSVETGNINGYYGGIGIEQAFDDPHASLFADIAYDYSRSHQKDLSGDLGGIRFVIGANLILF